MGFDVSAFKEIPIIYTGQKCVQLRDEKGRFTSKRDIIPDPKYRRITVKNGISRIYLIDTEKKEEKDVCEW